MQHNKKMRHFSILCMSELYQHIVQCFLTCVVQENIISYTLQYVAVYVCIDFCHNTTQSRKKMYTHCTMC